MATEISTVEMQVPGLCCLECSQGVDQALRRAPGVCDLRVLSMAEKVVITYGATATEPGRLAQVVTNAGHPVASWQVAGDQAGQTSQAEPHGQPNQGRYTLAFAILRLA